MVEHVGIAEAARIVGVTRARVYQRVNGVTGAGEGATRAGRLESVQELRMGKKGGQAHSVTVIPVAAVLQWRAERIASGLPVGPVPDGYGAPTAVIDAPSVADDSVGLPSVRAY